MPELDVTSLITNGGFGAGLLTILYIVGNRFIKSMDKLVTKVDDHHKTDTEHHAEVSRQMAAYDSKLETIIGWQERTPVEQPIPRKPKTPPGSYFISKRAKTEEPDDG